MNAEAGARASSDLQGLLPANLATGRVLLLIERLLLILRNVPAIEFRHRAHPRAEWRGLPGEVG